MSLIRYGSDPNLSLDWVYPARKRQTIILQEYDETDDDTCAVCLGDDVPDTTLLPCFHSFHGSCILKWVETNFTCPLCRQEIRQFLPSGEAETIVEEFANIWRAHYTPKRSPSKNDIKLTQSKLASDVDKLCSESPPKIVSVVKQIPPVQEIALAVEEETVPPVEPVVVHAPQMTFEQRPSLTSTEVQMSSVVAAAHPGPQKWREIWDDIIPTVQQGWMDSMVAFQIGYGYRHAFYPRDLTMKLRFSNGWYDPNRQWKMKPKKPQVERRQETDDDGIQSMKPSAPIERPPVHHFAAINLCGGLSAGVVAASVVVAVTLQNSVPNRAMLPKLAIGTYKGTVPAVGVFFMSYEHCKQFLFDTNPTEKSRSRTFGERFASATIAASIAHASPLSNARLPLRYGAFFGTFEGTKDLIVQHLQLDRQLTLGEVAASATVGGLFASALYYPTTRLIDKKLFMQLDSPGGLATVRLPSVRGLFHGWGSHLAGFLPACVACSCGFEFARRFFVQSYDKVFR